MVIGCLLLEYFWYLGRIFFVLFSIDGKSGDNKGWEIMYLFV